VGAAAQDLGLDVVYALNDVPWSDVDLAVVVAYGRIIPTRILDQVPMLNVHFSLLPRWRGAAPVERAILAGDVETGVCIMGLEPTLDTGPIYARAHTSIGAKSSIDLLSELSEMGARLLLDVVDNFTSYHPEPQAGEPTYAEKLEAEDFFISPERPADYALRQIRLGRAWTYVSGTRVKVREATKITDAPSLGEAIATNGVVLGTSEGGLILGDIAPEGSRAMPAADWWRGRRFEGAITWGVAPSHP
jgi:methionyl-tRNA formyltransferase